METTLVLNLCFSHIRCLYSQSGQTSHYQISLSLEVTRLMLIFWYALTPVKCRSDQTTLYYTHFSRLCHIMRSGTEMAFWYVKQGIPLNTSSKFKWNWIDSHTEWYTIIIVRLMVGRKKTANDDDDNGVSFSMRINSVQCGFWTCIRSSYF